MLTNRRTYKPFGDQHSDGTTSVNLARCRANLGGICLPPFGACGVRDLWGVMPEEAEETCGGLDLPWRHGLMSFRHANLQGTS